MAGVTRNFKRRHELVTDLPGASPEAPFPAHRFFDKDGIEVARVFHTGPYFVAYPLRHVQEAIAGHPGIVTPCKLFRTLQSAVFWLDKNDADARAIPL